MTIGRKRGAWTMPSIVFGRCEVPEAQEVELLGVIIDSQLTHASQLRSLVLKGKKRFGFLRRVRKW